jgi:transposase
MPPPHPREGRQRAVELARRSGAPIALIAKDLGISESWGVGCLASGPLAGR